MSGTGRDPAARPPRLPRALLRRLLDRVGMSELLHDLDDAYEDRRRRDGRVRAALWYWLQVLIVPAGYLRHHVLPSRGMRAAPAGAGAELRSAVRSLRRDPVSSLLAIAALAIGIGLTATMYSIIHGILRDLPFPDPDAIVSVERTAPTRGVEELMLNAHDYRDWRSVQTSLVDLAAFYDGTVNVNWGGEIPVSYPEGAFITPNAFDVLGVQPVVGRTFLPEENDPDHPPVLIISYQIWQERFDLDPGVVGRPVRVNGEAGRIVGVMPEGFRFPLDQPVWVPLWTRVDPDDLTRDVGAFLHGFGRLKPGVTLERAREEFDAIAARLAAEYPDSNEGVGARLEPYVSKHVDPRLRRLFMPMMGAVLFVLVVACGNVANLLVAQGMAKRREVATRAALGGGRARIAALAFVRAGLLATVGTLSGVGLTYALLELFDRTLAGTELPFWVDVRLDPQVLAFVALVGAGTTLLAGALPAFRSAGVAPADALRGGARGGASKGMGRVTGGLVVLQVALSFALLVGTGLVVESVRRVGAAADVLPTRILTGRMALFETTHPDERSRELFLQAVERELESEPGVRSAAVTGAVPGDWRGVSYERVAVEGTSYPTPESRPFVHRVITSPAFFSTFGLEASEGRTFDSRDGVEQRSVVVNESFVERFLPDGGAVGRRIRVDGPGTAVGAWARGADDWATVVGVVPDFFIQGVNPRNPGTAGVYVPLAGNTRPFMSVALATAGPPGVMERTLRETVARLNPDIPVYWVRTMQEVLDRNAWLYRIFGSVFVVFGGVALFLALLGVVGVVAQLVRRRRREMSVRLALGAQGPGLLGSLLVGTGTLVVAGIAVGLALSLLLRSQVAGLLFETSELSPAPLLTAGAVVVIGAALATLGPGAAVLRMRPAESLRTE